LIRVIRQPLIDRWKAGRSAVGPAWHGLPARVPLPHGPEARAAPGDRGAAGGRGAETHAPPPLPRSVTPHPGPSLPRVASLVPRWESDMNEKEGREAMEGPTTVPPQQNPQPQVTEVVVDDSATLPSYSNFCRVTATPEEVILDFGLNPQPFASGR